MSEKLRIATFNLENFDDKPDQPDQLEERIAIMKPQLKRLDADILCFQEVNGQETPGEKRQLLALKKLISSTRYEDYEIISTKTSGNEVYDERNLVILTRFEIAETKQINQELISPPKYKQVTRKPEDPDAKDINWERAILYSKVKHTNNSIFHIINLHLKSKLPVNIEGQKIDNYTWRTSSGWAEGFFIASMKRVGQALEARMLIDSIFDNDEDAFIIICGDFNATYDDVPVAAICGAVENTGNGGLARRVMFPCEFSVPETSRYSLIHMGRGEMIDHILVSRPMIAYYSHTEIHNELLHDESVSFATDKKFPESDHAPVVAEFAI
ncbi:MAG: endonuclease/exonuclease/phosphatase family protein [Acidobacteria bacterium]|nr:endonuclease/exonuclease/phosphatase family protein [Acidobacteriota bacterium]